MLKFIICVLLTYQQLFSLDFIFLPIRTRMIMAILGTLMLIRDRKSFVIPRSYSKLFSRFVGTVSFLFLIALVSCLINAAYDPFFLKFPIVLFISFASAYCYIKWIACIMKEIITKELLIKLLIGAALFQCILSVLVFILPPFREFIFYLVPMNEMNEYAVNFNIHPTEEVLFRMIPVGYDFWGNGTCLAVIVFLLAILVNKENSRRNSSIMLIILVFISAIGAGVSRTTLMGVPFFILYLLMSKGDKKNKRYLLSIFIISIPLLLFAYSWFLESNPIFESIFERAFSVFYIFKETGEMQSVESMVGQAVIPFELKTWVIGDGYMSDPSQPGIGFYKGVDIGIWRVIWGVGLIGLFIFSYIQYLYLRLAKYVKLEALFLFLLYFAFMYKGIFYFDLLMSPFIMMILYNSNVKHKQLQITKYN